MECLESNSNELPAGLRRLKTQVNTNWRVHKIVSFGGGAVIKEDGSIKVFYFTPKDSPLGGVLFNHHRDIYKAMLESQVMVENAKDSEKKENVSQLDEVAWDEDLQVSGNEHVTLVKRDDRYDDEETEIGDFGPPKAGIFISGTSQLPKVRNAAQTNYIWYKSSTLNGVTLPCPVKPVLCLSNQQIQLWFPVFIKSLYKANGINIEIPAIFPPRKKKILLSNWDEEVDKILTQEEFVKSGPEPVLFWSSDKKNTPLLCWKMKLVAAVMLQRKGIDYATFSIENMQQGCSGNKRMHETYSEKDLILMSKTNNPKTFENLFLSNKPTKFSPAAIKTARKSHKSKEKSKAFKEKLECTPPQNESHAILKKQPSSDKDDTLSPRTYLNKRKQEIDRDRDKFLKSRLLEQEPDPLVQEGKQLKKEMPNLIALPTSSSDNLPSTTYKYAQLNSSQINEAVLSAISSPHVMQSSPINATMQASPQNLTTMQQSPKSMAMVRPVPRFIMPAPSPTLPTTSNAPSASSLASSVSSPSLPTPSGQAVDSNFSVDEVSSSIPDFQAHPQFKRSDFIVKESKFHVTDAPIKQVTSRTKGKNGRVFVRLCQYDPESVISNPGQDYVEVVYNETKLTHRTNAMYLADHKILAKEHISNVEINEAAKDFIHFGHQIIRKIPKLETSKSKDTGKKKYRSEELTLALEKARQVLTGSKQENDIMDDFLEMSEKEIKTEVLDIEDMEEFDDTISGDEDPDYSSDEIMEQTSANRNDSLIRSSDDTNIFSI